MEGIVNDLSKVGKIKANIFLIIGIIVGIILFILAYTSYTKKITHKIIQATIKDVESCDKISEFIKDNNTKSTQEVITYDCVMIVSYMVDNKEYTNKINIKSEKNFMIINNKLIDIEYEIINPNNIRQPEMSSKTLAGIFGAVGLIIIVVVVIQYLLSKTKTFSAVSGADTIANLVGIGRR
jgi:hypothetical protein